MRYAEAIEYLFSLQQFGAIMGLERARELARQVGNPQECLQFIHVAGTNGKGSTCAMLEGIYRQAGRKVGLYTSPHLVSFAERIQVNRQLIPEPDVARLTSKIKPHIEKIGAVTFFEAVTIMAMLWFEEQKADIVIWETGLGGRLDATNIVTPLASVITNIQRDHEKWLGHTLSQIAREKAGIIKPNVPVFTAVESPRAFEVIRRIAKENNAQLHRITEGSQGNVPLLGPHQRLNAALARLVALKISDITGPMPNVFWPGRFDLQGRYVLDGAHNPDGAATLRKALEEVFPGQKFPIIVGVLADKDIGGIARELIPVAGKILTIPVQSARAATPEAIAQEFRDAAPNLEIRSCISLESALKKTENDERVVITGSLHFIGEAMEHLGLHAGRPNERSLNDWKAP